MEFRRIVYLPKKNRGNTTPRTNAQRNSARVRMILSNPLKLPANRNRRLIRKLLFKQQP